MSKQCPIRAESLRITRTDNCGIPVAEGTPNSRVTTAGFIRIGLAANTRTSNDIETTLANGSTGIFKRGRTTLRGFDVTLEIECYNLAILELLRGIQILTDYTTPVEDVGGVLKAGTNLNTVMLEWWSENANNDACAVSGGANPTRPYIQSILPRVTSWELGGNIDVGDSAQVLTLTGFAEATQGFAPSLAADEWTAADITSINDNGFFGWRETTALPSTVAAGYDP